MKKLIIFLALLMMLGLNISLGQTSSRDDLLKEISEYVKDKDATIGVAVIVDRTDTIEVNGNRSFPMLSVYKFPIAIALGEYLRVSGESIPDSILVSQSDLRPDTYSPMRDKYAGVGELRLPFLEVMAYALQQSDNNASDILLKMMGGKENAMEALRSLGISNVNIASTEEEMHNDPQLCYANSSTPIAMAKLLDSFDKDKDDDYSVMVKQLMETCSTGQNRLAKPLEETKATIGHKTGTGFILPDGRLMAINDVGYVHLPSGKNYSIVVFIENSGYDMAQTEEIIAEISKMVYSQTHVPNK